MKTLLIVFALTAFYSQSQNVPYFRFGSSFNLSIYAPYTSKLNNVKSPYTIKSKTLEANIDFRILIKNKWSLYSGVTYKKINYRKIDAIASYGYSAYCGSQQTCDYFYVFDDPVDLVANSHSLGLAFEVEYELKSQERYSMSLGLKPSVYFLEWYKSFYYTSDETPTEALQPLVSSLPRNLFLSSINSQLIYRVTLLPKKGRTSWSGKISLGANIFSDWEQFKRYAWLGVGLEVGLIGKQKE